MTVAECTLSVSLKKIIMMHMKKNTAIIPASPRLPPKLTDYEQTLRSFSWERAATLLSKHPAGGLNMAFEAVDRHAENGLAETIAFRFLRKNGSVQDMTYAALSRATAKFANVLTKLGLQPEDRVFSLLGRVPQLYTAAIGTLKKKCVFCPLFSAFGPEPIRARLERGNCRVLITTSALLRKRVEPLISELPDLSFVLLTDADEDRSPVIRSLPKLLESAAPTFSIPKTAPEDMALLHFTSGTTGTPKGAVHVHGAILSHLVTGKYALDLGKGDIFWCTADPGWVTGTSYGIMAPLAAGATSIVDEQEFDAKRWYSTLERERVNVWYTAPTAIRMLMKAGSELVRNRNLNNLRLIASVGEPLNPEGVKWGHRVLGRPIHDNWWQTETGGIMIANFPSMAIKPGSMGRPLPGVAAAIVQRTNGTISEITEPDIEGELALRPGWPSMFRGYLHDQARYDACFSGGYYLTGDLARKDSDGYFWFVGRKDDVIKSAGHLIGPFEVESTLMEHPAVAEAAVIGVPDPVIMEKVLAFVALKPEYESSEELIRELTGFARKRLGPAVAPREIRILQGLPKTRSGKIMRRLLKARELGLPEGDTSTLETGMS